MEKTYPFKNIIVISDFEFSQEIIRSMKKIDPNKNFMHIDSYSELLLVTPSYLKSARLIAFFTKIIVPKNILNILGYGAYNFHPGSPQYPGWAPYSFALYQNATSFGITLHEMIEEVDAGPIVALEEFPIYPDMVQVDLEAMCLSSCLSMMDRLAKIFCMPEMIPTFSVKWGTKRTYQKDFQKMCELKKGIGKREFQRLLRAFGGGDGKHLLHFKENNQTYQLDLTIPQESLQDFMEIYGVRFGRV